MLVDIGMEVFAEPLMHLGITEISDMQLVSDAELDNLGMKLVQVRKIRNATVPPATGEPEHETAWSSGPLQPASRLERHQVHNKKLPATINRAAAADADSPGTTDRAAAAEANTMVQCTNEVQVDASKALGKSLAIGVSIGGYDDIIECI
eukprot:15856443-Heterocapsa_arctica.AAC.1